MKKLKLHLPKLSRPQRTVCNVLLSLFLAVCVWIVLGSPLPLKAQFRLTEKSMLVGPSEIIWQQSVGANGEGQRRFLIADAGDRYIYGVFRNYGLQGWNGSVIPWEKEGDITLMPFEIFNDTWDTALKMVLLHNVEGVQYAQADIPLEWEIHYDADGEEAYDEFKETYTVAFTLDLMTDVDGIMQAILLPRTEYYVESTPKQNLIGYAERAAEVFAMKELTLSGNEFLITVRLYDADWNLLREETLNYSFPEVR